MTKERKPRVVDPPRFPKVINGYEKSALKKAEEATKRTKDLLTLKLIKSIETNE